MKIPISVPYIGEEEITSVNDVLRSGKLAAGEKVTRFENAFASYTGVNHAVAVSSGTAALCIALKALGVGPRDKVLTTPFSFIATANSILYCGAEPVFADVDQETFNIDPAAIEKALSTNRGVKALIVVHLYGLPCDMDPIMDLVQQHGIFLVEDCAQAHGAVYNGRRVGSLGHAAAFSFYPTKNMTTGEGGMITTNDPDLAARCRMVASHGAPRRYHHETLGFNYRMTDIAAAIGLEQLKRLDEFIATRQRNAYLLSTNLGRLKQLKTPLVPMKMNHVFNQYTVRVPANLRTELCDYLEKNGVGWGIHYPQPIHLQPLYRNRGFHPGDYPVSEKLSQQVLSLPVHPSLTTEDIFRVIKTLTGFTWD